MAAAPGLVTPELRGFASRLDPPGGMTPLVGRDQELRAATRALQASDASAVNLCGLAGSGKSRLAQALAAWAAERYADGYVVVDLENCRSRTSALAATCAALDLTPRDLEALGTTLTNADLLLVLDHADAVGDFVPLLCGSLAACRGVRVAVCTELPLRTPGVIPVRMSGLATPPVHASEEEIRGYPAVQAFGRAAELIDPGFELDDNTVPAVATICRAVGGLPLALELLAARTDRLGVQAVAAVLDSTPALDLLGPRGAGVRHPAGLRSALLMTYDLLAESERTALRRLAVLHDPFPLDTAVALTGHEPSQLFDDLSHLADLRLVEPTHRGPGDCAFQLAPLVRELSMDQLRLAGEEAERREAHARYFAALAHRAAASVDDALEGASPCLRGRYAHDLAAASDWLAEHGSLGESLQLAADLVLVTPNPGSQPDLSRRLEGLLSDPGFDGMDVDVRADALLAAAAVGLRSVAAADVVELAERRWRAGIELARTTQQPLRLLRALRTYAVALPVHGDFDTCAALLDEGRALATAIGHARWLARFEAWTGMLHHQGRRFDEAGDFGASALARALRADDRVALINTGMLLHTLPAEHRPDVPLLPDLERVLELAVELGDTYLQSMVLANLAGNALASGDAESAARWVAQRLDLVSRSGEWRGAGFSLMTVALLAGASGELASAARWHGAVTPMLEILLGGMAPRHQEMYRGAMDGVRRGLGEEEFRAAALAGGLLTWQDAVAEALPFARAAASRTVDLRAVPSQAEEPLTPRETQVLQLLAGGLSNKEIGRELSVTPKSVMHHSVAIYRKLGVRGRAQAAAVAIRRGLVTV